jgi:hypothetical protein
MRPVKISYIALKIMFLVWCHLLGTSYMFCSLFVVTEFYYLTINSMGRDSSIGIATDYGLDGPGFESRWGARFFAHVQTRPEAHPASCTIDTGSFPGVKRPRRGADHPPPSSAEVKKE